MWRFICLTFAFLAFAFYELSGGADYAPVANSIQVKAAERAAERERAKLAQVAAEETVSRVAVMKPTLVKDDTAHAADDGVEITLASAKLATVDEPAPLVSVQDFVPTVKAEPALVVASSGTIDAAVEEAINVTLQEPEVFSLETYAQAAASYASFEPAYVDYRTVTGDRVNMRAGPGTEFEKTGFATRGTEIRVLDEPGNGWVMLEIVATGETGWMADWLLTASN